jgi:type 1 glutamine amidotransferase
VLMSLNMAKCKTKRPYHVPVAWAREWGEGRIFYTNLGHNPQTWANKQFLKSTEGAVRWVIGLENANVTPNPEVSKAQEEKAKADAAK